MKRGRPRHPDVLTPAEWRVANAVRHGLTNRGIGRRLGISLDAVKYHVANALGKLSLSARTNLKHWHGAPHDSALHVGLTTMTDTTTRPDGTASSPAKLGPIGQISRQVHDIEAAVTWYRDILGLTHLYTFGTLAFFDCGGVRLFLSAGAREEGEPGDSILYFRTDDIEAAHRRLTERGVAFRGAPHLIHRHESGMEEWMAFFEDLDGKILALMSQVSRPS
jgi:DNA-binding CsgD family transcriptional regulator/catechol 2,3-dioxygenase-like lactoylglutathione lyase family enzyme